MSVGGTIQGARRRAGLTQEQLAAKVYVTRQVVSCCGNALEPLAARRSAGDLDAAVEVEGWLMRVYVAHPMTKDDHLLFIAAVGDDLVRIRRLYPEQEDRAEFWLQGPCRVYVYGSRCGLVEL